MSGRRLFYLVWALALVGLGAWVAWGIGRSLAGHAGYGWAPGQFLVFDEDVSASQDSRSGPFRMQWDCSRKGRVQILAVRRSGDGDIELLRGWRRERPVVTKDTLGPDDVLEKFGKMLTAELDTDPVDVKRQVIRETGDPVGETFPTELDAALDTVFERTTLLPGGRINVGDEGEWRERVGPLEVKFAWSVARREPHAGRDCLVYEVKPSAVLAVKPETLPNRNNTVWHSLGKDEGYVTTRGSATRVWLSVAERLPVGVEMDRKWTIVPQKWVADYYHTVVTWTLAEERALVGAALDTAVKDSDAIAVAEKLVGEKRVQEARDHWRAIAAERHPDAVWTDIAEGRAAALEQMLPMEGRPCPQLPEGAWSVGTPKTIEDLRGKVVLLDFWVERMAQVCAETMKTMERLHSTYGEKGLYVVGVTQEEPKFDAVQIHKHVDGAGFTYPILIAREGIQEPQWQVKGMPYSILVDKHGIVRWTGNPADAKTLEAQVQTLLAEK